jgi:hypothetical protein
MGRKRLAQLMGERPEKKIFAVVRVTPRRLRGAQLTQ